MAVQVYTFKITYADCKNKIWRKAAVSSNYTLAELGYMVLATFDTLAYHLFEMEYKGREFFLTEEDFEDLPCSKDKSYELLGSCKLGDLGMSIGDTIEMVYDFGCEQVFTIKLLKAEDMPKGSGRAYPKILSGKGRGIVDDMFAFDLLKTIEEIDAGGHSEIYYSSDSDEDDDVPEWDYRDYNVKSDNVFLKGKIDWIRDGYENGG